MLRSVLHAFAFTTKRTNNQYVYLQLLSQLNQSLAGGLTLGLLFLVPDAIQLQVSADTMIQRFAC